MKFSIFTLLVCFFSLSAHATIQETSLDRLEASVNSQIILQSDISDFKKTEKLRAQLDPLFAGTPVASQGEKADAGTIVQFLIDEKLITQQFAVTDAEVEQEINSIQANNHIDRAKLKAAIAEQGFSFDEYFELIRASASKRNLIDRDIRTKVSVSDDDVKNYYFNHYEKSGDAPLSYHILLISVPVKNYKTAAGAKDAANQALKDLRAGDPFEEVAKRFGDVSTSDLGIMTENQIAPALRAQVKRLQIGQTSEVFGGTSAGSFLIVKLADLQSGDNERYEKMKEEIRNQLMAAEYQHQISLWLERQRQNAFIHVANKLTAEALAPVAPGKTSVK